MRKQPWITGLAGFGLAFILGSSPPLHASTVDLSWDFCAPIVADKTMNPNLQLVRVWASVIGHSDAHAGYELWIAVNDAGGGVPDAWRFDVGGCQPEGYLQIDHINPAEFSKACPSFQGTNASIQIKSYQPAPSHLGLSGSPMVAVLANVYPNGVFNSVPATRYFLAAFLFDHTWSVAGAAPDAEHCGGLERSLCFSLLPSRTNYVTPAGEERPFTIGNGMVTVNGGDCFTVPAAATTWGGIKGQYRR